VPNAQSLHSRYTGFFSVRHGERSMDHVMLEDAAKTIELSEEEQRLFSASCEPHPVRGLS